MLATITELDGRAIWARGQRDLSPNAPADIALPLHCAASAGSWEVYEVLLRGGLDVEAINSMSGAMALHAATIAGHQQASAILPQHGADPDIQNYSGSTATDFAMADDILERLAVMFEAWHRRACLRAIAGERSGRQYAAQPLPRGLNHG